MGIEKSEFGKLEDGTVVHRWTLTNGNGLSASFTDLGAVWMTMVTPDQNGTLKDVILGYDDVASYVKNPPHLGAPIGRNANRIGGAVITINGVDYPLAANNGPNNLHSGPDYYHCRMWQGEEEDSDLGSAVQFTLLSPDMDQGFPGNADIAVTYTLTDDNALMIQYCMIADKDTVANFTNHSYFNLAGHDSGDIRNQEVWIHADCYTPADENAIPTGEIVSVKGTPMDFTRAVSIGAGIDADFEQLRLGHGYDHNWVLNGYNREVNLCASVRDPQSGRVMEVYTDLPGLQFYTGNGLKEQLPGKGGAAYKSRCAYCFETQYYPDAVHKSQFPSPLLKAGEEYKTTTIYQFPNCRK